MNLKVILIITTALVAVVAQSAVLGADIAPARRIPAFPGAEGYGMYTSGGRGGTVYEVTTLADSGPGSLRDAVSRPGRTVVFRVSGTIALKSSLVLDEPNITIAGQTAPGLGICLRNYALRVNARNIVIRYLRVRPGDQGNDRQVDGISMGPRGGADLIFDHCSVSWAMDENFSIYGLPNVTVQWCIISEGVMLSRHPKSTHSMGGILSGYDMTMHHNVFISNNDRNPKFNLADWWPGQNTDFRNNIVYNWGARATWGGNGGCTLTNVVNNYYKAGPDSISRHRFLTLAAGTPGEWYVAGNTVEGFDSITRDNWSGVTNAAGAGELNALRVDRAFSSAPVTTQTAAEAYRLVLQHAGANLPKRDAVDERVLGDVVRGTGRIINSQIDVGGWPALESDVPPPTDTDHDGMPDDWERSHKLDPADPDDHNGLEASGYTHLESYLNSLIGDVQLSQPCRAEPAEAFWPSPASGSKGADASPSLRWKAGFGTVLEKIYFGDRPDLGERDLKATKPWFRRIVDKQEQTSSVVDPGRLERDKTYYWRVDSVNETGTTTGVVWSFTTGAPASGPGRGADRMEAEAMTSDGVFVETNTAASGAKVAAIPCGVGSLRFVFDGAVGRYRLALCHLDERDGAGRLEIFVNGRSVGGWVANENSERFVLHSVGVLNLSPGDEIKVVGARHRDELSRIDYLSIAPAE